MPSLFSSGLKTYFYSLIFNCFYLFFKCFTKWRIFKFSLFIILLSDGNISSPVRYSCLSILPDDNVDIFVVSLLILYCSFSSLILSSSVMDSFHILSKRFFLKHEELSDARLVSITKKENGFAVHFLERFIKSWRSVSDEWLNAICISYFLLGIS